MLPKYCVKTFFLLEKPLRKLLLSTAPLTTIYCNVVSVTQTHDSISTQLYTYFGLLSKTFYELLFKSMCVLVSCKDNDVL